MPDDDTSEYSSSKAPETVKGAEEESEFSDPRLIPGGAEPRSHTQQGIAGLDWDTVPSRGIDMDLIHYGDTGKDDVTG
ncbi:MAG TPA: hypothetical protein VGD94_11875 [Vicinamibacterales bacterium]